MSTLPPRRSTLLLAILAALGSGAACAAMATPSFAFRMPVQGMRVPVPVVSWAVQGTPVANMGTVAVGSSSTNSISVQNTGAATGTLSLGGFTGSHAADYAVSNNCSNVLAGSSCSLTIQFTPGAAGTRTASLVVAGTTYNYSGVGTVPLTITRDAGGVATWSDGSLASSCNAYLTGDASHLYQGSTGTGKYAISLEGTPTTVYCDMTSNGGGWTLVLKAQAGSVAHMAVGAVGTLTAPNQATVAKLSDSAITSIPKTVYRVSRDDGAVNVYFDTSDSFSTTRQVSNRASETYPPVWEGPFYQPGHSGFNTFSGSGFNRGAPIVVLAGDAGCRQGVHMPGYTWCGPGNAATVWVK